MCTALAYKTKDFYFGRTLDYESSYGEEIVITPRQYPFAFRNGAKCNEPLCLDRDGTCGRRLSIVL